MRSCPPLRSAPLRCRLLAFALAVGQLATTGCTADASSAASDSALPEAGTDQWPGDLFAARDGAALAEAGAPRDSALPLDGLGQLYGACGVLDEEEWAASEPLLFRNTLDFGAATFEATALSAGGQQIWSEGNLGGSSLHSEVFAFEAEHRCELAALLKTEAAISYQDPGGTKIDLLVEIDGRKIGVSVTRAFHYPPTEPYTATEAATLLEKKLGDLPLSQANAAAEDAWSRSILHVLAYDDTSADLVEQAWRETLSPEVKGEAILILTVTEGNDAFLY